MPTKPTEKMYIIKGNIDEATLNRVLAGKAKIEAIKVKGIEKPGAKLGEWGWGITCTAGKNPGDEVTKDMQMRR